jgi:phosphoribosylanthranilate isomerase
MSTIRVKICGLTNVEDAMYAARAGADYLGFVFWPHSKRAVTTARVREIVRDLRKLKACPLLVGVFVDETAEKAASILDECRLDLAQLSGDEPPALIGEAHSPLYTRSYKVLHPTSLVEAQADAEWYVPREPSPTQPHLLIDAYHPALPGCSGKRADWAIAATLAREVPGIMLAGGLTPQNVKDAVRQVRPFAVDVASGVEATPGRKDHDLVQQFIMEARNA